MFHTNSQYNNNSIMNTEDEIHRKTEEFLQLIKPIPKQLSAVRKIAKKQAIIDRRYKSNEERNIKEIKKMFDENEILKSQLREIRKQKREIKERLEREKNKQLRDYKNKRIDLIEKLKNKQKQLSQSISVHPRVKSLKEAREKKKLDKILEYQTHKFDEVEYECVKTKSAFGGYSTSWIIRNKANKKHEIILYDDEYMNLDYKTEKQTITSDVVVILNDTLKHREQLIEEQLNNHKGLTINEKIFCIFRKFFDDQYYYYSKRLPSDTENKQATAKIYNKNKIIDILKRNNEIFLESIDTFIENGSNWQLFGIKGVDVDIDVYRPLGGSSYIELPDFIKNKKCCINVKNNDNKCFARAIQSYSEHECIKDHHDRVSSYNNENFENLVNIMIKLGVTFPFAYNEDIIHKIEKKLNVSINIYTFEMKKVEQREYCNRYRLLVTNEVKENHINLLYYPNDKKTMYHYAWIKNFNRFMSDITKSTDSKYFCMKCLLKFDSQEKLDEHYKDYKNCDEGKAQIKFPKENEAFIEFKHYNYKFRSPFVIYADFESIIVNNESNDNDNITSNHKPCGFMFNVVSIFDKHQFEPVFYRGENTVYKFLMELLNVKDKIMNILQKEKDIIMTEYDKINFSEAVNCHICEKELKDDRVRDHCHITGRYIGAAHNECNVNRNYKHFKIPVFFHNGKGYDSHFIINEIANISFIKEINMIPKTEEKYICYDFNNLKFLDSLSFMNPDDSLEKLIESLRNKDQYDITKFVYTKKYFKKLYPNITDEDMKLIITKGVYPYEYMNSFERFNEEQLPPIEKFYSSLNNETIYEKDYIHALKVWKTFKIKSLGEYHDFYLKTDVLLLTDIFENFRNVDLLTYNLDPAHYITGCSYSMDAALRRYGKKIQLFHEGQSDMYLFVEKAIRGGMSFIATRHSKANNKYMKNYDPTQPSKYIMYLDANNLYGWAMNQKLSVGGYKWENIEEWNEERIKNITDDDERGYIFEVDLEYPKEIHDRHNLYPLCPEKKRVQSEWLSNYQKEIKNKLHINDDHVDKLITDLTDKSHYILHYKNLQLYIQLGMKLNKIHKCLSYKSEAWLKDYITSNSVLRQKAKADGDAFKTNIYKIKNNSVFGKQMENVRNRVDIKLMKDNKLTDDKNSEYLKLISQPRFKKRTILNENLVAVHRHKKVITLDKPILNGMIILDLSKYLMYDFYYNILQKRYGDKMKLLMTDTDSLVVEIETEDVYEDMGNMKEYYDFSEYPKELYEEYEPPKYMFDSDEYIEQRKPNLFFNKMIFNSENQAVVGKFKDEFASKIVTEFVVD